MNDLAHSLHALRALVDDDAILTDPARIVYAVLTGLNLIAALGDIPGTFAGPWYSSSASLLTTALDLVIVVLLFRPASNAWYRARGRRLPPGAA